MSGTEQGRDPRPSHSIEAARAPLEALLAIVQSAIEAETRRSGGLLRLLVLGAAIGFLLLMSNVSPTSVVVPVSVFWILMPALQMLGERARRRRIAGYRAWERRIESSLRGLKGPAPPEEAEEGPLSLLLEASDLVPRWLEKSVDDATLAGSPTNFFFLVLTPMVPVWVGAEIVLSLLRFHQPLTEVAIAIVATGSAAAGLYLAARWWIRGLRAEATKAYAQLAQQSREVKRRMEGFLEGG